MDRRMDAYKSDKYNLIAREREREREREQETERHGKIYVRHLHSIHLAVFHDAVKLACYSGHKKQSN